MSQIKLGMGPKERKPQRTRPFYLYIILHPMSQTRQAIKVRPKAQPPKRWKQNFYKNYSCAHLLSPLFRPAITSISIDLHVPITKTRFFKCDMNKETPKSICIHISQIQNRVLFIVLCLKGIQTRVRKNK